MSLFYRKQFCATILLVLCASFTTYFSTCRLASGQSNRAELERELERARLELRILELERQLGERSNNGDASESNPFETEKEKVIPLNEPEVVVRDPDLDNLSAGDPMTVTIAGKPFKFRWCPPGEFVMGSPTSEEGRYDDETQHTVKLTRGFWLCEFPVTHSAFADFVDATGYKTEAERNGHEVTWKNCFIPQGVFPVVMVSWNDAQAYVDWVNENYAPNGMEFRLPSEAHWEYACRAGTMTPHSFGSVINEDKANFGGNVDTPTTLGRYAPNAWGLYDMHGNVWEWCSDWYGEYPEGVVTDPEGPQNGTLRVFRGGDWNSDVWGCRSAKRDRFPPWGWSSSSGFRLEIAARPSSR
ncbi:MAG: SUMF1/EgtB/PvdO family nonheme iron enzyme [Thermoguttaceae bacterium]|nr:SUMF1/EgtB/PvdO family nonheme iron enzyme [Thermoguttaceae bacterium]